jgi:hypothetical protein
MAAVAKFRQAGATVQRGAAAGRFLRNTPRKLGVFYRPRRSASRRRRKTMTRFLALIAATLLAFAAQAGDNKDKSSHDTGMKSSATFDALDKNADSQISKTEASADSKLSEHFAALDTNGDGYLSKAEFMARSKT